MIKWGLISALLVATWFSFGVVYAAHPVVINKDTTKVLLGFHLEYFEDKEGKLTLDDVLNPEMGKAFIPSQVAIPNFGFTESAYWFSLVLKNSEGKSFRRLLELSYPHLDSLDVYLFSLTQGPRHYHFGRLLPFEHRLVDHRNFLIPIEMEANEETRVVLRVKTREGLQVPLVLWQAERFIEYDSVKLVVDGLYFGLALVMAIYNLFVFFSLKERSYLYYVLFVVACAGYQSGFNGLSYQYLWPNAVWWSDKNLFFFGGLAGCFSGLFANEFLSLRVYAKWHFYVLSGMAALGVFVSLSGFLLPYTMAALFGISVIVVTVPVFLSAGILRWRQGSIEARYYTVAWASLLAGGFALSFVGLGFLPANNLTINGMQLGSAIEIVLLSLALARRLRTLTDDNLRIQKEAAQELQGKVDEATTELREQAQQLKELDRQKTVFFQNISHELRTPLTLILNPLDEEASQQPDNKNLGVAAKNSRRLLRLVNQLLDFQKLEAGKKEISLEPINLVRFIHICGDYFASACSSRNIAFKLTLDGIYLDNEKANSSLVYVHGEIDALEKVAFNFLSNALKYTPKGGTIELGLELLENNGRIFVRDTGSGISEQGQSKLFEVFSQVEESTTREYEGTGLGLALVKSLTEEMGGQVGVESRVGEGSKFWAEFPICKSVQSVRDLLLIYGGDLGRPFPIDGLLKSTVVGEVEVATTLEEVEQLFRQFRFRCVISDDVLPGKDGVEILAEVAKESPGTHRILLTDQPNSETVEIAMKEGWVDECLTKPINEEESLVAIERGVAESRLPEATLGEGFKVKGWLLAEQVKTGTIDGSENDDEAILHGEGELVLVVDDLPDMRDLISSSLNRRNYQVVTAPNGLRGLESAKKYHPDLIVTDWMMPQMSGPDLIKELKNGGELSSIPVILLTAKSDEESKLIGTEIGADAFLGKPFNDQELTCIVRNLLSLKAGQRQIEKLNQVLVENVLKRYLPPDLVDQIISGETTLEQEPESVAGTVLFSDLVGFTSLSGELRATKIARILNEYLTEMVHVIYDHGGTIDKFMGDAIMVIFGAPTPLFPKDQALKAATCAKAMQRKMQELNDRWAEQDVPRLKMRIGIHHGPLVVGTFGCEERSDYTAIGPTVNTASRIESICEPGQVFVSGEVCDFLPEEMAEKAGKFEFKGVTGERNLYRLVGIAEEVGGGN